MASLKEREKEPEYEIKQSENRNMRRGKPQQQIYRPGSGPLRKSTVGVEETESDTKLIVAPKQNKTKVGGFERLDNLTSAETSPYNSSAAIETVTSKLGDVTINNGKKKSKKPEQSYYVARPVALARGATTSEEVLNKSNYSKNDIDLSMQANGNDNFNTPIPERLHNPKGSKRYSHKRYYAENSDNQDDWRTPQHMKGARQGSEPRAMSNQNNNYNNRIRDTRSVEPIAIQNRANCPVDKVMNRPPSGRRHSTIGLEQDKRLKNLVNLPPRLKKKFLEENNLTGNYNRNEEQWDGSSITFQGSQNYEPKQNFHSTYSTLPSNAHQNIQNQRQQDHQNNVMYHTLPSRGPRGRGRSPYDYGNMASLYRSATPERMYGSPANSRPQTPPKFDNTTRSNESLHRNEGAYHNYRADDGRYLDGRRSMDRFNDDRRVKERYNTEWDRYRNNDDRYREEKFNRHNDRNSSTTTNQSPVTNPLNTNEAIGVREHKEEPKTPRPFRESLEAQLSPVSPPTPPEKEAKCTMEINLTIPVNNAILDWSEEVELNDRLQAEALSDALTRSSSIASLMEVSTKSLPPSTNVKKSRKKKNRRNSRKRSSSRNRDMTPESTSSRQQSRNPNRDDRTMSSDPHHIRKSSVASTDSRDFKVPDNRRGGQSRNKRDGSYETSSRGPSRDSSFDRRRKSSCSEQENWREEARKRQNSIREQQQQSRDAENKDAKIGGILILPSTVSENTKVLERPKCPDISRKSTNISQKTLFDPNNPNKPIVVKSPSSRVSIPGFADNMETPPPQLYTTDQFGNVRPPWYDENSDKIKQSRYPDLLREIIRADTELQSNINSGMILINWGNVIVYRKFLMKSLEYLLCKDMKFCQLENVEQHFWKILFYNIIEMMRKAISTDQNNKEQYKGFLLYLIDEGVKYFEMLLDRLEEVHDFKIADYLTYNATPTKGKSFGLVLVSIQKIFLYLGDLLRYKEQVNETSNYGKCRQWYVKAQEINPKNGKPYNQLALLAVYARRKLDAVYYYMRSLMSSNPAPSARESLNSLFDENRKKYEQSERKRREERLERARQHMKEKESQAEPNHPNSLRREVWIRPDGGRRVHRTTSAVSENPHMDSEEEDLTSLSSVDVNKRFVTSYLHVHGKLITKIGMESFQETAIQMLKEFRALLQHSPVPLPCKRFLQLLALNMFAIESTQLKDPQLQSQSGYRSELQERALVVSLQMFSLILERCVSLLQEHIKSKKGQCAFPQDLHVLLPAVKTWCDWMLCHSGVWNPPPSTQDYKVGAPGDAWTRIATLMNLLEKLEQSASSNFVSNLQEGYEQIRLPEDAVLSEFTPLMHNVQEATFVPKDFDMELAQFTLRISKLVFFGTVFLCGLEPPVLKLQIGSDCKEYVSVVRASSSRSSPPSPPELNNDDDLLVESFSEDEEEESDDGNVVDNAPSEIRDLLSRKVELEKRQRHQELHRQRVQKILRQSVVSVHIEVRPKYLIPDTNCFIDYLDMIKSIASAHVYTLMVPLVVLNELEGLAKGGRSPAPITRPSSNPEHMVMVAESAKYALDFVSVKNPSVKCITTKGTILASSTFTVEDDSVSDSALKNDDKILASCLAFCKPKDQHGEGEPRKLYREVVLLTEDRNLRVKALARDVPVRELPDFIKWAGLG